MEEENICTAINMSADAEIDREMWAGLSCGGFTAI